MKDSNLDYELLRKISPVSLAVFVSQMGWSKAEPYRDIADIYQAEGKPELILPRDAQIPDYPRVVSELIRLLAKDANEKELTIYRSICVADRDVVRLAVKDLEGEGIPLRIASKLIDGMRRLFFSAACSLSQPRPVYGSKLPANAREVLQNLRFGHTEPGSFVIQVMTSNIPKPMLTLFPDLEANEAPLTRQLTDRLHGALHSNRQALVVLNTESADSFSGTPEQGISANFCESLATIVSDVPVVEFKFSWAGTRPRTPQMDKVTYTNYDKPILEEVAKSFRKHSPLVGEKLHGFVHRLTRNPEEDAGKIGFVTLVNGKTCRTEVQLSEFDYERAIEAHQRKSVVVIDGDLARHGTRWVVQNAELVGVLNDIPDEPELEEVDPS